METNSSTLTGLTALPAQVAVMNTWDLKLSFGKTLARCSAKMAATFAEIVRWARTVRQSRRRSRLSPKP